MTILEQIEQNFSTADKISFIATQNLQSESSVICLCFNDINNHINTYNLLCNSFDQEQLTTVLRVDNDKISLQIIDSDTADIISINNLTFDKDKFKEFQESTPNGWRYLFVIGVAKDTGLILANTTSMLTFVGYKVI